MLELIVILGCTFGGFFVGYITATAMNGIKKDE